MRFSTSEERSCTHIPALTLLQRSHLLYELFSVGNASMCTGKVGAPGGGGGARARAVPAPSCKHIGHLAQLVRAYA